MKSLHENQIERSNKYLILKSTILLIKSRSNILSWIGPCRISKIPIKLLLHIYTIDGRRYKSKLNMNIFITFMFGKQMEQFSLVISICQLVFQLVLSEDAIPSNDLKEDQEVTRLTRSGQGNFVRNNGVMRSLRSDQDDFMHNNGIMRSLRSAEDDFTRNNGIMRSLRSAEDDFMRNNGIMRSLRSAPTRNNGIMRSLRSDQDDFMRNNGIMRSLRSAEDDFTRNNGIMRSLRSAPRDIGILRSLRSSSAPQFQNMNFHTMGVLRSARSDFKHEFKPSLYDELALRYL